MADTLYHMKKNPLLLGMLNLCVLHFMKGKANISSVNRELSTA